MDMKSFKEGLIHAIYTAQAERDMADVMFADEKLQRVYKAAAANLIVMLIDEIVIQCGEDNLIELQTKYL